MLFTSGTKNHSIWIAIPLDLSLINLPHEFIAIAIGTSSQNKVNILVCQPFAIKEGGNPRARLTINIEQERKLNSVPL